MIKYGIMVAVMSFVLVGTPQERVIYVPGWHRCHRGADEAFCAVQTTFPGTIVSTYDWDGNCRWKNARTNADAAAAKLAGELISMSDDKLSQLTLVGHSLGARIIVRALAKLAVEGKKIKTAVILAAAMPSNDPDAQNFTAQALGLNGPAMKPANCRVITVLPETTRQTPLTALWTKIDWFRMIAAHYAPFYLEQLKRSKQ